jgi:hypothetical protein
MTRAEQFLMVGVVVLVAALVALVAVALLA